MCSVHRRSSCQSMCMASNKCHCTDHMGAMARIRTSTQTPDLLPALPTHIHHKPILTFLSTVWIQEQLVQENILHMLLQFCNNAESSSSIQSLLQDSSESDLSSESDSTVELASESFASAARSLAVCGFAKAAAAHNKAIRPNTITMGEWGVHSKLPRQNATVNTHVVCETMKTKRLDRRDHNNILPAANTSEMRTQRG